MNKEQRLLSRAASRWLLFVLLIATAGCVSETRPVDSKQPRDKNGLPVEVLAIPQQMQEVAGDMLRFHSRFQTLPPSLSSMVDSKIMSPKRYAELPDYLYSPGDRYTLRDGRVVILVDSKVRVEGHAWCIVKEPQTQPRTIQLSVTPVPLKELEAAARQRK